jgi:hypothetical protein
MPILDGITAPLPHITLEELVEVAELLHRTDRKYVVTEAQLSELVVALEGDVRVLSVEGRRSARYDSVYFDTPQRESYLASAHRRRRRFKVRTRSYLDSQQTYLEVKVRDARRRTVKLRTPYAFDDRGILNAAAYEFLTQIFIEHGLAHDAVAALVPTLHTEFCRVTLFIPSAGCRMTLDTELRLDRPDGDAVAVADLIILETKSDAGDRRVDRLLWRMGVRPQSVSKFAIGSALLDPTLPDNKWSRTISRHFASALASGRP